MSSSDTDTHPKEFQYGLCGCFKNVGLCVVTYMLPCYVFGKIGETLGEECMFYGFLYILCTPYNCVLHAMARGKIRERKKIPGTFGNDLAIVIFCPCCSLIQERQELDAPQSDDVERS